MCKKKKKIDVAECRQKQQEKNVEELKVIKGKEGHEEVPRPR
jgi:hypothetical protein